MATRPKTGGRKAGTPNKATAEVKVLASVYGPAAIEKAAQLAGLVEDVLPAASEAAQMVAINTILDRAYGKPTQPLAGDSSEPPIRVQLSDLDRAKAIASIIARQAQKER